MPSRYTNVPKRMRDVFAAMNDRYAPASYTGVDAGTGGCSSPGISCPRISSGKTRCSGNQIDSKPSSSASTAASNQNAGFSRPNVIANFTPYP